MHVKVVLFLLLSVSMVYGQSDHRKIRTIILVLDGLRPDYITPDLMPNLAELKKTGAYATAHHSVFPTVTRVNASSYATGSYPASHGLLGNTVYFPEVDAAQGLNTGDAKALIRIAHKTDEGLLTAVSLGELLNNAGERMMVFSSGSSGQAFLQNHTLSGGAIINPELILPHSLEAEVITKIGDPPASGKPNSAQHDWATRAWLAYGLEEDAPLVSAIWLSDPDATAHSEGMGHPMFIQSLKSVDSQVGVVLEALQIRNRFDRYNIIVTADHGFVTHVGKVTLAKFLVESGLKRSKTSDDIIIAGNAVYIKDKDPAVIRNIVAALQEQPWVGAIFTSAGSIDSSKGWAEGSLSFQSIHWNHERSADILVDYNWDNRKNVFGYVGTSFASGVAGHGGASPYEIHIPLIAAGPSFKKEFVSETPTSNVDLVPTILHFYKMPIPASMNGRVMTELLEGAMLHPAEVRRETFEASVKHDWGTYILKLQKSIVGDHEYIDFAEVRRTGHVKKP